MRPLRNMYGTTTKVRTLTNRVLWRKYHSAMEPIIIITVMIIELFCNVCEEEINRTYKKNVTCASTVQKTKEVILQVTYIKYTFSIKRSIPWRL